MVRDRSLTDSSLTSAAQAVADIPVFFWMDVAAKVPTLGEYLAAASAAGGTPLVQAVIYDLPDRDCAAESSAGEYSIADGGAANYQAYIDAIAAQVDAYPDVRVVFVVEPDGLPNLVTNSNIAKCANAASTYKVSPIQFLSLRYLLTIVHRNLSPTPSASCNKITSGFISTLATVAG